MRHDVYDLATMVPFTAPAAKWIEMVQALQYKMVDPRAYHLGSFLNFILPKKIEKNPKKITIKVTKKQAQLLRRAWNLT